MMSVSGWLLGRGNVWGSSVGLTLCLLASGVGIARGQEAGFESVDIGGPAVAGEAGVADGLMVVRGGGLDIGARSDQGHFYYQSRTGDFDVRVQLEALEFQHVWTEAGLMVRASLEANSAQASVLATPSISGIHFMSRNRDGNLSELSGHHRVNYPSTWLRLAREASRLTGYASFDGIHWRPLGTAEFEMPETVHLGVMVSSHVEDATAAVRFRGLEDVGDEARGQRDFGVESFGPSSRRSGLVVSEVMYQPMERTDGRDLEFVELMNTDAIPIEIGGFRLSGSVDYEFPPGMSLAPGAWLVVAKVPEDMAAVYGDLPMVGGYEGSLPNGGGVVRVRDRQDAILLEARYEAQMPWPIAAAGAGHSLVLARASYGERSALAWSASNALGGSPGTFDPVQQSPWDAVVINEVLANSEPPLVDFVEVFNGGTTPVDLGGVSLSDDPRVGKFRFAPGTSLPAGGFLAVDETELGFALSQRGERVFLRAPDGGAVVDAIRFAGQATDLALGRFPNGGADLVTLSERTPGASNANPQVADIVINEIMYHPISGENRDEYLELLNTGATAVNLAGWRLAGGIAFEFPADASIAAGGYLVIGRDVEHLRDSYSQLTSANSVGNYSGTLGNGGDSIQLLRPEGVGADGNEALFVEVDQVTYVDGGDWGRWSDGGGSSLELRDPSSDNRFGRNWADSDESQKSEWMEVENTGFLDLGRNRMDDVQIFLQGAGEVLVDDVAFLNEEGNNFVVNGGFDDGDSSWQFQGTHDQSTVIADAEDPNNSLLHLVATARGDNGANRVRYRIRRPFAEQGTMGTLRARVRWLRGHPEILVRVKGNYLEAIGRLAVPKNLGSPGLANGAAQSNTGPVIRHVRHFPVLPQEGEPVRITAEVTDPHGIAGVELRYRIDPNEAVLTGEMNDRGTDGDAVAGDGIYSFVLPAQPVDTVLAFAVAARDGASEASETRFPAGVREALIRYGEEQPSGNFGTYRIWFTEATRDTWTRRLRLHNGDLDATFVYGNDRAVYQAGTLYSGSPFVSPGYTGPTGVLCGYVLHLPPDDTVMGATDFVLDWPIRDGTLQVEQVSFWIGEQMDVPYLRRRNINLLVDGVHRGRIYEDVQQPNRDVMEQFHSDKPRGELYKIEDWFEFTSTGNREFNVDATLRDFRDRDGNKFLPLYRYNWRKRAVQGSAHDYDSIFELVDAANLPPGLEYEDAVSSLVDLDAWMRVFAVEHIVGNWDSFGYRRGKNMYAYKPEGGKWVLHMWDIDFALTATNDSATTSMFNTTAPVVQRMYNYPPFQRIYFQAMKKAVEGPLRPERSDPVLQANFDALAGNGIRATSIRGMQRYISTRLSFLERELERVDAPFSITTNGGALLETDENVVLLSGTAPIDVRAVSVNGLVYPVRWTGVNAWQVPVVLPSVENLLEVRGISDTGEELRGAVDRIRVRFTGVEELASDHLVISEIMYQPTVPGAEFVELHNSASHTAFGLGGYRVDGLGFAFEETETILPGEFRLIVADEAVFTSTYGANSSVAGAFGGRLNPLGETLRLMRLDPESGMETVIDEVRFEPTSPWPDLAAITGSSLQLIDAEQDNDRVANWVAVGESNDEPEWLSASVTGRATSQELLILLTANPPVLEFDGIGGLWNGFVEAEGDRDDISFRFDRQADGSLTPLLIDGGEEIPFDAVSVDGDSVLITWNPDQVEIRLEGTLAPDGLSMEGALIQIVPDFGEFNGRFFLERDLPGGEVFLDDVTLVPGSEAGVGENLVSGGSFETALEEHWTLGENHAGNQPVEDVRFSGQRSLLVSAGTGGVDAATGISQTIDRIVIGEEYTLSFRYLPGGAGQGLTVGLGDFSLVETVNIAPPPVITTTFTPGFANAARASITPFPTLRINEVAWSSGGEFADGAGDLDPWVEIYNTGEAPISLDGLGLSQDVGVRTNWVFPEGSSILPGEFGLVWLDGELAEHTSDEWHAGFRLDPGLGPLLLTEADSESGARRVVDYVRPVVGTGSWGLFPDGQANTQQRFSLPSPGMPNRHPEPAELLFISEWMAQNRSAVEDPAGMGEFDDWFELFNAGTEPVDLSGYSLSDAINEPTKFRIPEGTVLGPGELLLVWADEQGDQFAAGGALHANFKLSRAGESIGLYAPGGELVDFVEFGPQEPDVSEGRVSFEGNLRVERFPDPSPGLPNQAAPQTLVLQLALDESGQVVLQFAARAGGTYQLRSRDSLSAGEWMPLGDPIVGDGELATVRDESGLVSERYYSVVELEEE